MTVSKAVEIAEKQKGRLGESTYSRRARTVLEHRRLAFKQGHWIVVFTGFIEPVLYLFSFGFGVGKLVGKVEVGQNHFVTYAQFIAPALLATSAMNGAIFDSTWNVFFRLKYDGTYKAMLATSLGPLDVAMGEIGWALFRGLIYATGFTAIVMPLGLIKGWYGLLAIPAAVLIAFGFASMGMLYTSYAKSFQHMDWVNIIMLPLFLFSGSLYPLSIYPLWLQRVIEALPLWHAISIIRDLCLGQIHWMLLIHFAYFFVMIATGLIFTTRRLRQLFMR
jgi:lipooligosaccharide transport system permease protein